LRQRAPDQGAGAEATAEAARNVALLRAGARLREAALLPELRRMLVNEACSLCEGGQAILLERRVGRKGWRIEAVSAVAAIDRNAPLVAWLENALASEGVPAGPISLRLAGEEAPGGGYPFSHGAMAPLAGRDGMALGLLAVLSISPLWAHQLDALGQIARVGAHALGALGAGRLAGARRLTRPRVALALVAFLALLAIPAPMTVLAPAEVVARDAEPVAASMEGVIERIAVAPNAVVRKGDLLFSFNAVDLANRAEIARRTLETRRASFRRAEQDALGRGAASGELGETRAEFELAKAELDYALQLLARAEVRSPVDGVAIYADRDKWIGRPVKTGERVLLVADPAKAELRAEMAIGDAIELETGAAMRMFLAADPLNPLAAKLTTRAYSATKGEGGNLAYALTGEFAGGTIVPRLGLRGTAQVSGARAPLGYFLFRKPIAASRQWLGL
jgi:hypothetical protein